MSDGARRFQPIMEFGQRMDALEVREVITSWAINRLHCQRCTGYSILFASSAVDNSFHTVRKALFDNVTFCPGCEKNVHGIIRIVLIRENRNRLS